MADVHSLKIDAHMPLRHSNHTTITASASAFGDLIHHESTDVEEDQMPRRSVRASPTLERGVCTGSQNKQNSSECSMNMITPPSG